MSLSLRALARREALQQERNEFERDARGSGALTGWFLQTRGDGRREARSMTRQTSLFLAAIAFTLPLAAPAQEDPGLELLFQDFKAAGIEDPEGPFEEDLEQELGTWLLSIRTNNARKGARMAAYHALEGEGIDFGWKSWNSDLVPEAFRVDKLYGARYRTTWLIRGGGKLVWSPFMDLGIYSDFRKISIHDLRIEGGFTVNHDQGKSERSSTRLIGFGAGYVYNLGEPKVLPLFKYYRRSEHSSFDILLPLRLDCRIVSERVDVGLAGRVSGNVYRITENREIDGVTGLRTDDEIEFSVATGGLFAELKLGRIFRVKLEYGRAFHRVYRVVGRDGGGYELDVEPNQYWTLGAVFRR
jgi:hypothetical protein